MTENSLVLAEGASHAITTIADPTHFLVAAAESGIAQYQFTQIKTPAGGGTTWEYEGPDGEESGKELDVIVAYVRTGQRRFYLHGLDDGEASAPDWSSEDGVHGLGFDHHEKNLAAIEAITLAQVRDAARQYFHEQPRVIVKVAP